METTSYNKLNALRTQTIHELTKRISGDSQFEVSDLPSQLELIVRRGNASYRLIFSLNYGHEPVISGGTYRHEYRTLRPHFERRKCGTFNFESVAKNVEQALTNRQRAHDNGNALRQFETASQATLDAVSDQLGFSPTDRETRRTKQLGQITVELTRQSPEFVRVELRLPSGGNLRPDELQALIEKLAKIESV